MPSALGKPAKSESSLTTNVWAKKCFVSNNTTIDSNQQHGLEVLGSLQSLEHRITKMSSKSDLKAMNWPFKDPKFIFFTDFDGTITLKDSNDFMVKLNGSPRP